jgi:ribosome production factor 1
MPSKRLQLSDKASLPFKTSNKHKREELHIKQKKARGAITRAERFARKKEEAKNPHLKEERLRRNVPQTIDSKRTYEEVADEPEDGGLGVAYHVEGVKRRKLAEDQELPEDAPAATAGQEEDDDRDSMLESDSEAAEDDGIDDEDETEHNPLPSTAELQSTGTSRRRATSPTRSTTSTNLSLAPAALAAKFPSLFQNGEEPPPEPKILITTSINSTLHAQAQILVNLFPNSKYIRRSAHRYGYKFSVREISSFAHNQGYTAVVVLEEDQKKPCGMTLVHLPVGPTFHFSISNWYDSKSLPGHGKATNHVPELILNNFTTPLGLLTAHLFRSLFPQKPDLQGRQVITFHNQRDFIFMRRFRYVLRDKRETEKSLVGSDGKPITGAEEVRAGLQELGPRLTLKLRRVDKGIQRKSGQEWEWKGKTDRVRTKFQL